ncbi:MAG: hypothetical protein O3B84_01800 [Chloroflexi bacterium]|nr:hypothetical protein [Chloroflexota bacterium]
MNNTVPPTITDLPVGWGFPAARIDLADSAVARYHAAVGPGGEIRTPSGKLVSPSALATLCIGRCLENVILPEGTLHIGEDVELLGAVPVGAALDLRARIRSSEDHRGVRIVAIDMWASMVADGAEMFVGRATLMIPGATEGS